MAGPIFTSLRPGTTASFEEMLQRLRAVGNAVSDLTGPRFDHLTYRSTDERFSARPAGRFNWFKIIQFESLYNSVFSNFCNSPSVFPSTSKVNKYHQHIILEYNLQHNEDHLHKLRQIMHLELILEVPHTNGFQTGD